MGYKLDPKTGKYVYVDDGGSGSGSSSTNAEKTKVVQDNPASTSKEIKGTTDNLTEENADDVFGRGKAKGDFRLRKYSKINITGTGKSFEGTYFISEVTHTLSPNGYDVDFSIKTKQENIGKSSSYGSGSSGSGSGNDDLTTPPKASEASGRQPEAPSKGSTSGGYKLDPVTGKYTKI